jgi:hypothetical protein
MSCCDIYKSAWAQGINFTRLSLTPSKGQGQQAMIRSNSLEDVCAPQKQRRRSNFVERKDGSTTGSMSLTDDTVSSWSCSTPGSGGK